MLSTAAMPFSYLAECGIRFAGPGMYLDDRGLVAKVELRRIAADPARNIAASDVFVRWYWPGEEPHGPCWRHAGFVEDAATVWLDYHRDARAMFTFPWTPSAVPSTSSPDSAAPPEAAPLPPA